MAFGLRYYNEFTSRHYKRLVRVEIFERDYIGASKQIKMGARLQLSDSGDGREVPIKKLTASLRLLSESNFQFEHLFTADDRKYQVKITRNEIVCFIGFLESDSYSEPYYSWKNYTVNLTARDNLGRLEDIPYLDVLGDRIMGLEQASVIIDRVLNFTGYDINIEDGIGIWSADMNIGLTILQQTYINNDAFWNFEDNKPLSCLDVLTNVISAFGAQIRQISNRWEIVEQSKYYDRNTAQGNSASFPSYLASKLNFPLITKAFKWINRDAAMTVLPAWKEFSLEQDYKRETNIFRFFPKTIDDYTWTGNTPGQRRYSINGWNMWDLGSVFRDSGGFLITDVLVGTNKFIESPATSVDQTTNDIEFTFNVTPRTAGGSGNADFDIILTNGVDSKILTSSGWIDYTTQTRELSFTGLPNNSKIDLTVIANGFPIDGDLYVRFWSVGSSVFNVHNDLNINILSSDNDIFVSLDIVSDISADNNLTPSNFQINIGQVPDDANAEIMYLGGLFTSAGVAQVDWKREGDTTADNLLKKVAIGYDLQNKQPSRQVNGTVIWDYDLWTNIDDQNKRLMINSADWDLNTDEMNAEWVQVFEYKNTLGAFDLGYNEGFDNQSAEDYQSNTIFTLTQKTE